MATKKMVRRKGLPGTPGRWTWLVVTVALGGIGALLLLLLAMPTAAQQAPLATEGHTLEVPYGHTPTVDGRIAPGEVAGASQVQFEGTGGTVTAYVRHDAASLYVAFDLPDTTPYPYHSGGGTGPAVQVFLDTDHDQAALPQPDDYRLTVTKGSTAHENQGYGTGWGSFDPPSGWAGAASVWAGGWQAEFGIPFAKVGITYGTPKTIGLALANVWTVDWPEDTYWPAGGDWNQPNTWGDASSSEPYPGEAWTSWYFKADGWADYAPSGVPDFDQKQDKWGGSDPTGLWKWSYCGPVAAANSLWWFDSKFEPNPLPPSPVGTKDDGYPLVHSYGPPETGWDDHYISNTVPLVEDLAVKYFATDPLAGTHVFKMVEGLQRYLADHHLQDDYYVTLVPAPDFHWIADEVLRSEDVILLLGFYEGTPDGWRRVGGHYVTVAGVDPVNWTLALSDPYRDAAETTGVGRVRDGTLLPHPPGHPEPTLHNDAGNVSHDYYAVVQTPSPGGGFGLEGYVEDMAELESLFGVNPHPEFPTEAYGGGLLVTELEYAIAVSPFTWKRGRWTDYSPSGVPDFDQKQDFWGNGAQWTYCGPAALADALWYLDSRFEPYPWPAPPPAAIDYYPLIKAYGPWDDHAAGNVESQTPAVELVDDLAFHLDTDGQQTGAGHTGTHIADMEAGLQTWLVERQLAADYTISTTVAPSFQWVVAEVERCELVVLLLGFWQEVPEEPGTWQRLGGHYVTVAGVDGTSGLIGLSDPWFDRAEAGWPWPGRVLPLGTPHPHPAAPPDAIHNDAALLSHDIYRATVTPSPGGVWGLADYIPGWGEDIENFLGQNGDGDDPVPRPGQPIWTEVEWALALSPLLEPDLAITKRVTPTSGVAPGDWLTYTVVYTNLTTTPAYHVVLTDVLPPGLINPSCYATNTFGTPIAVSDTYIFELGGLGYREGGIVTITAQVSPSLVTSLPVLTNTAEIRCSGPERDLANNESQVVTTLIVRHYLPLVLRSYRPP